MSSTNAQPIIIGHRGACGYLPEHTIASYLLAIEMGADYIEPDLVSTKDGVLIARHENDITATTNVSEKPEFANRRTTKNIDGKLVNGWFSEDFNLVEIQQLFAKERLPFRNHAYDHKWGIPTLQEIIDLVKQKSKEIDKVIGIYPETKHPTYFKSINLSLEELLVFLLKNNGYTSPESAIFIQSFEVENLQQLKQMIDLPLIQLLDDEKMQPYDFFLKGDSRTYGDLTTPKELRKIAEYADGIGVYKRLIVPINQEKSLKLPTSLIQDAHAVNLMVHAWTFRNEVQYLAADYQEKPQAEYEQFFQLGIDGVFSDFPNTAFEIRNQIFPSVRRKSNG